MKNLIIILLVTMTLSVKGQLTYDDVVVPGFQQRVVERLIDNVDYTYLDFTVYTDNAFFSIYYDIDDAEMRKQVSNVIFYYYTIEKTWHKREGEFYLSFYLGRNIKLICQDILEKRILFLVKYTVK